MFNLFTTPTTVTPTKKKLISAKTFQITCSEVLSLPNLDLIYTIVLQREKIKINNFAIGWNAEEKTLYTYIEFYKKRKLSKPNHFDYLTKSPSSYLNPISKQDFLEKCLTTPYAKVYGNLLKNKLVREHFIMKQIEKGVTTPMFFNFNEPEIKRALFNESIKFDRYVKQHQLFLDLTKKKDKPRIISFSKDALKKHATNVLSESAIQLWSKIFDILNNNINPTFRYYKKTQLHLWSKEPNMGKSALLNFIKTTTACYMWPQDNWWDHYENYLYQFILWDEFSLIGKQVEFLNQFLAGDNMRLAMKGNFTLKQDNPLVIMTSNDSLEEHVKKKFSILDQRETSLKALKARIVEIEITESLIGPKFVDWEYIMQKCVIIEQSKKKGAFEVSSF